MVISSDRQRNGSIGRLPESLQHLTIINSARSDFGSISTLRSLRTLTMRDCTNLDRVDHVRQLTNLRVLDLTQNFQRIALRNEHLSDLVQLKVLHLQGMDLSEDVSLAHLRDLVTLTVDVATYSALESLHACTRLRDLRVRSVPHKPNMDIKKVLEPCEASRL